MAERNDTWFVVVNPHAGSGRTISAWQKAEVLLRDRHVHYASAKTERKKHAVEIVVNAAEKGYRQFVAVGGDGTVHEVLNGIMIYLEKATNCKLSDFTLAVIPIGSGNDWIKTHNIPRDIEDVVNFIAEHQFGYQEVVKVTQYSADNLEEEVRHDYLLNVGGVGFDARVCERVNARKDMGKGGKLLYVNALLKVIKNSSSFPARVLVDGENVFEGNCYSIALGTGPYSGGGMRQVPRALPDDGLLDMMIVPVIPLGYLVRQVPKLFSGNLDKVPEIVYAQGKQISILPVSYMVEPVEVDGEVVGQMPVVFDVLPDQIRVLSNRKK